MKKLLSKAITNAHQRVLEAQKQYKQVVYKTITRCKHKHLGECDYQSLSYGRCLEPLRVCLHCGLTEEGWGCGYIVLEEDDAVVALSRDEVYERISITIDDKDKTPLLRKEITLNALLKNKLGV